VTTAAALATVGERLRPESGASISYEQALTILDQMLTFLRGGLDDLPRPSRPEGR